MIFCGDIAIPFRGGVKFVNIPGSVSSEIWVGNLEGSLCADHDLNNILQQRKVYNNLDAIEDLTSVLNFGAFGVANNHLKDAAIVETTLNNIKTLNRGCFGAGNDLCEAQRPIVIEDYVITAFGWEGISCQLASSTSDGVNPYDKWAVIEHISSLLEQFVDKKIICFMHWNYELELYPQPLDRQLSHELIDMGVYAVIGCHAHRVQPIEIYKGHPIVYGLGNFAFMQNTYMGGKLAFPDFSSKEIAFEIDDQGVFKVHEFVYNKDDQTVSYVGCADVVQAYFAEFSTKEYIAFFKTKRFQRKMLPVFYYDDVRFVYKLKIKIVYSRQKLIQLLVKNAALFKSVKRLLNGLSK